MICLGVVHFGKFAHRGLAKVCAVATLESLITVGLLPFCHNISKSLREFFPKARLYLIPMRNSFFQARKDCLGKCRHAQRPRISMRRVPRRGAGRRGSGCRCGRVRRKMASDSLAKISRRPYAAIRPPVRSAIEVAFCCQDAGWDKQSAVPPCFFAAMGETSLRLSHPTITPITTSFNSMPGPGDLPGSESDCVTRWELQVTKDGFYPGA
jgi:hypothetical protein